MTQFIHLIDGKLMVGKRKPTSVGQVNSYETLHAFLQAQLDMHDWETSLTEVKNEYYATDKNLYRIYLSETLISPCVIPGQQVQASEGIIIKII